MTDSSNMAPLTLPQLSATGKYLTDADGNVVILRGYNLCSKTAQSPEQLGFDTTNANFLAQCGVSVVRLGVPWVNVQPYLAYDDNGGWQYDMVFLASIKRTIQLLASAGIYTLVDFHQDAYSAPWGFGAPTWALIANGTNTPYVGWPINTFGGTTFQIGGKATTIETDLNFAFDAFWNNTPIPITPINATAPLIGSDPSALTPIDTNTPPKLWDVYGAMLTFVSSYLSDQQGNILGYDPMNEPEPGSQWIEGYESEAGNIFNFPNGFPQFDPSYLAAFYQQCAIPALRAGHPDAMIWFEPNIYFDYNAPTFLGDIGAENVGFNFHNYDSASGFTAPVTNALNYQNVQNVPLLCSEFGGTTDISAIQTVADINDQNMLSSIFWAWFNNAQFNFAPPAIGVATDPRAMGVVQLMSEDLVPPNVHQGMLNVLTRAYPRVVAGTPISFSTNDGTFSFQYSTTLPNGQLGTGTTQIVVPSASYPNATVTAPSGVTVTQSAGLVELVVNSPTPSQTITVQISSGT